MISDELLGIKESPIVLAAHFDGIKYTAEKLNEIRKFSDYVKIKRKHDEHKIEK